VDKEGVRKQVGLVVDFVGVLRELKKALQFDSSDVEGVIEDLDLLLEDFLDKIGKSKADYLDAGEGGDADERLERLVYGRFLEPEARKAFFEAYKDIENLWEVLSPSKELVDHIGTYKRLVQLYAAVRNAYADKIGFVAVQNSAAGRAGRNPGGAWTAHEERHLRREDPRSSPGGQGHG
jgi:type I restriction enzyme, R subunit